MGIKWSQLHSWSKANISYSPLLSQINKASRLRKGSRLFSQKPIASSSTTSTSSMWFFYCSFSFLKPTPMISWALWLMAPLRWPWKGNNLSDGISLWPITNCRNSPGNFSKPSRIFLPALGLSMSILTQKASTSFKFLGRLLEISLLVFCLFL